MWFLYSLSWISMGLQILFVTLAIAAALYYLAEIIEEYTVLTKKILRVMLFKQHSRQETHCSEQRVQKTQKRNMNAIIYLATLCCPGSGGSYVQEISCGIYLGLWAFEGFPFTLIGIGLFTNLVEFALLQSFPYIELTSPIFVLTVVLVFVNHYFAFEYFSDVYYAFSEVLAFFTLCLWLIPFTFFISLSASDNVLPSTVQPQLYKGQDNDVLSHYMTKGKKKRSVLLTIFENCKDFVVPSRSKRF